jgi:hypothetical protein
MLNEMQASLLPYLGLVGENPWLQALSVVCASWLLAWIFDRFISSTLKKLAQRTRFEIDDALINYLHNPVYTSVILLGFALAVNLLKIGEPYDFFIFSSLQTVAYLVWTVFLLRVVRTLLRKIAANDERLTVLHPQTLPLFENLAIILIIVLSVYIVFSAWGVDRRHDRLAGVGGHRRHRGRLRRQGHAGEPVFRRLHHGRRTLQDRRFRRAR